MLILPQPDENPYLLSSHQRTDFGLILCRVRRRQLRGTP